MEAPKGKARLGLLSDAPVGVISVYDPAVCCSTGVCGPEVDPEVVRVAGDLRWLAARGVAVERFNLAQEPRAFVENPRVAGLLRRLGEDVLPVVLVNGEVGFYGDYPSREALVAALKGVSQEAQADLRPACEPGSGCC
jgi:hypothetical protein